MLDPPLHRVDNLKEEGQLGPGDLGRRMQTKSGILVYLSGYQPMWLARLDEGGVAGSRFGTAGRVDC